jgi:hypothetical protein
VLDHELGWQTQDAVAELLQGAITPRIGARTALMVAAVDFHDKPNARCQKVDDEPSDNDLPAKRDAKLAAREAPPPQDLLRPSWSEAHLLGASLELC